MRLIDADVLPKYTGYALSADEVARAVENAPTIEAEPVHGKWVGNKTYRWINSISMWWHSALECSVCGEAGIEEWNYCPNCGAKMEIEE